MMKLFLNSSSPYARVVHIVLIEKDLAESVELCWCNPWGEGVELLSENPTSKIPVLITESGLPIYESLLISGYLEDLGQPPPLIPQSRKVETYHLVGLGQGLIDATFTTVISEKYLGKNEQLLYLGQRRFRAIERTLQRLANNMIRLSATSPCLGDIVIAVALDYLQFRLPELGLAHYWPELESWRTNIGQRSSFKRTSFQ